MSGIEVKDLTALYRINQKDPGVRGAVKALFGRDIRDKVAVDHINFRVTPGEVVAISGVNGAGKSTTIKMLIGILAATSGAVQVMGRDPHRQRGPMHARLASSLGNAASSGGIRADRIAQSGSAVISTKSSLLVFRSAWHSFLTSWS
ncbi:MAG: ATP-binding cassette domain-containing protein [Anaerolineae bacterium]|uniref:ATP-binding cassette domain-containing protein n=1 Tax=Candidatus Amarolinea dominans TaxID=3140696 RepID=UPI0031355F83|nr:ATP-binding cassette domain-containing protein [Anaerolineae bacterium]